MSVKTKLKLLVPLKLKVYLKKVYRHYLIKLVGRKHAKLLIKVKRKDKIKVAFFLINQSVWKYEQVYRLMENDPRFKPIVVVCPYIIFGEDVMKHDMDAAYDSFKSKGYNVIKSFDSATGKWIDVKKTIQPDIVFFTNPHKLTKDKYYINNWKDTLTCYVPYAFMTPDTYADQFNQSFHNLVWKAFYETAIHKEIAEEYADNKGDNVIVTGYPGCDIFLDKNYMATDVWKLKDREIKRIIWAPHHLMEEGSKCSNFLDYYDFMFLIAKKYSGKIQIAFKPHPLVKPKLYKMAGWGKERTELYYNQWAQLSNGQLEEGEYADLFLTSDALIHDSGSFITEYIMTGHPSLFMISNEHVMKGWNRYGDQALSVHYHSRTKDEVISFIDNVVIANKDPMYSARNKFLQEIAYPPNNKTASENIFDYLTSVV